MSQETIDQVMLFMREHKTLIEVLIFLMALAESIIIASAFVPSSILFVGIGALEGAASGPLLSLVLAGAFGALVGDIISYALGAWQRDNLHRIWPLSAKPELIIRAHNFFVSWGIAAVLVSKLSGPFRSIVPLLAGASDMPWPRFVAASAVSSVLWSTLVLVPAYYGAQAMAS